MRQFWFHYLLPRIPQLLLTLIGKFGSAGCFVLVYVFTAELFPTNSRNSVIGFGSMMARVGCTLSMLVELLGSVWGPLPMVTLGLATVVAGAVASGFPETAGQPMPDTAEEAVAIGGENKEALCSCQPARFPLLRAKC